MARRATFFTRLLTYFRAFIGAFSATAPASPIRRSDARGVPSGRRTFPIIGRSRGSYFSPQETLTRFGRGFYQRDIDNDTYRRLEEAVICEPNASAAAKSIMSLACTDMLLQINGQELPSSHRLYRLISDSINRYFGGDLYVLVHSLLHQLVTYGALSCEVSVDGSLASLDGIHLIDPKTIYFRYNEAQEVDVPYQLDSRELDRITELNPITYKYIPIFRRQSPYGVPPFLSALNILDIYTSLLDSTEFALSKQGAMGVMKFSMTPPERNEGESDAEYDARCTRLLDEVRQIASDGVSNGILVTWKDQCELDVIPSIRNADTAQIFQRLDELLGASLNTDPSILGRSHPNSDRRVSSVMDKYLEDLKIYQSRVACFMTELIRLIFLVNNVRYRTLFVEFRQPRIRDRQAISQANRNNNETLLQMFDRGLLTEEQLRAQISFR